MTGSLLRNLHLNNFSSTCAIRFFCLQVLKVLPEMNIITATLKRT